MRGLIRTDNFRDLPHEIGVMGYFIDRAVRDQRIQALGAQGAIPNQMMHVDELTLMVAKIAHAYTSAEVGHNRFEPTLAEIIRTSNVHAAYQFVGGVPFSNQPQIAGWPILSDGSFPHGLTLRRERVADREAFVVLIQLFSWLERPLPTPIYQVVSGWA